MIKRDANPRLKRSDLGLLGIAEAKTDAFAGSLVIFNVCENSAEVEFRIHPDCRGRGAVSCALELAARCVQPSGTGETTARTLPVMSVE